MGQEGPRTAEKWRIKGMKEVQGRLSIMTATLSEMTSLFDGGWGFVNGGGRLVNGGRKVVSSEGLSEDRKYEINPIAPIKATIFQTLGTPLKEGMLIWKIKSFQLN
jgi:hypothetical protein